MTVGDLTSRDRGYCRSHRRSGTAYVGVTVDDVRKRLPKRFLIDHLKWRLRLIRKRLPDEADLKFNLGDTISAKRSIKWGAPTTARHL